jgi:hypothetical protein
VVSAEVVGTVGSKRGGLEKSKERKERERRRKEKKKGRKEGKWIKRGLNKLTDRMEQGDR